MHRVAWLICAASIASVANMSPSQMARAAQDNASTCVYRQGTKFFNRCNYPVTHEWCVYSEQACPDHLNRKATIAPNGSIETGANNDTGTRSGRACRGVDSIPADNPNTCK